MHRRSHVRTGGTRPEAQGRLGPQTLEEAGGTLPGAPGSQPLPLLELQSWVRMGSYVGPRLGSFAVTTAAASHGTQIHCGRGAYRPAVRPHSPSPGPLPDP